MKPRPRAFSLLELLLGVTVTAMVGLSSATVASTLSTRYAKSEDYYQSVQTVRVALGKTQSLFRSAQLVTQVSPTQIMLWQEPAGGDGQINPSELILVTYSNGEIRQDQIVYPPSMPPDVRLSLDAPTTLGSVVEQPAYWADTIQNGGFRSSRVVASSVGGFSVSTDVAIPMSRVATITVTSGQGAAAVTLRSQARLRGDRTGCVAIVGGHYALVAP